MTNFVKLKKFLYGYKLSNLDSKLPKTRKSKLTIKINIENSFHNFSYQLGEVISSGRQARILHAVSTNITLFIMTGSLFLP